MAAGAHPGAAKQQHAVPARQYRSRRLNGGGSM